MTQLDIQKGGIDINNLLHEYHYLAKKNPFSEHHSSLDSKNVASQTLSTLLRPLREKVLFHIAEKGKYSNEWNTNSFHFTIFSVILISLLLHKWLKYTSEIGFNLVPICKVVQFSIAIPFCTKQKYRRGKECTNIKVRPFSFVG